VTPILSRTKGTDSGVAQQHISRADVAHLGGPSADRHRYTGARLCFRAPARPKLRVSQHQRTGSPKHDRPVAPDPHKRLTSHRLAQNPVIPAFIAATRDRYISLVSVDQHLPNTNMTEICPPYTRTLPSASRRNDGAQFRLVESLQAHRRNGHIAVRAPSRMTISVICVPCQLE